MVFVYISRLHFAEFCFVVAMPPPSQVRLQIGLAIHIDIANVAFEDLNPIVIPGGDREKGPTVLIDEFLREDLLQFWVLLLFFARTWCSQWPEKNTSVFF